MKRVGIYAGTFDPIHTGHLSFAKAAAEQCRLDKVFFLVEPSPRYKQAVRALGHRQYMTQLALEKIPGFGTIMIDQQQFSVTETLPHLQARFKGAQLFLLLGDDVLKHLLDWPNVDTLMQGVTFIVGRRHEEQVEIRDLLGRIETIRGLQLRYRIVEAGDRDISSGAIRLAYKRGVEPEGVPEAIQEYIASEKLYASSDVI